MGVEAVEIIVEIWKTVWYNKKNTAFGGKTHENH
jgi:hypothetical protein